VPPPPGLPPPPPPPPYDEPVLELEGHAEVYQATVEVPSGVFFSHNDETALRSSRHDRGTGYTIEIFLHNDAWVASLSSPVGDTSSPGYDLIMGIASAQSEARGWNRVVVPRLLETPDVLHRVSDTHLLLRLDAVEEYDILAAETLHITVPASAVVSQRVLEALPVVPIFPVGGSAVLDGTCVGAREELIRSLEPCTIDVTLADDAWADGLDASAAGQALVDGLHAIVPQPGGWDSASVGVLSASSITVLDATRLSIEIPQMAGFDILSAQQIRLSIPPVAVLSNHGFDSNNTVRILPSAGRASLSGSLLQSLSEESLSGGSSSMELTISLKGDSFIPFLERNASADNATDDSLAASSGAGGVAAHGAQAANGTNVSTAPFVDVERAALLAGIRSEQNEPSGWNAIIGPRLATSDVVRVSATEVRLTMRSVEAYAINEPETVTVTLPAQLLSSQEEIVASPLLRIAALRGTATLGGPLLSVATEALLRDATRDRARAAEATLHITIGAGDGWAVGVGEPGSEATAALLAGLTSEQSEANGWNAVIGRALEHANVSRPVNGTVTVQLPQLCDSCPQYSIGAPDTVRLVVPAAALLSSSPISAAGSTCSSGMALDGSILNSNRPRSVMWRLLWSLMICAYSL
jgi:hypothetical protein